MLATSCVICWQPLQIIVWFQIRAVKTSVQIQIVQNDTLIEYTVFLKEFEKNNLLKKKKSNSKLSLKGSASFFNILHATINFSSSYNINQIRWSSVHIIIIDYGKLSTINFTDDVMVVLVHKCVQQTHIMALHLETLGYSVSFERIKWFSILPDNRWPERR